MLHLVALIMEVIHIKILQLLIKPASSRLKFHRLLHILLATWNLETPIDLMQESDLFFSMLNWKIYTNEI